MHPSKRKVILHYHIFKNGGSSVDAMLKASLGAQWAEWDKPEGAARISAKEMEDFILAHPQLTAVSSHQVVPPLPSKQLDIFPIVFIRHPIDRAYSAYLFEWKKQRGEQGALGSFEAYVAERLQIARGSAIEDFQTLHLANQGYDGRRPAAHKSDEELLDNAKAFLRNLPAFGLVNRFDASMAWFKAAWGRQFPQVSFASFEANVLQSLELGLPHKVAQIRSELTEATYTRLVMANQLDLRLYEYAAARFDCAAKAA